MSRVQPLERDGVVVLLLLVRFAADHVGAVVAGLVTVPGERRQIHEDHIAGLDDPVGKIAPVRPGIQPGRNDHVFDVLHARYVV